MFKLSTVFAASMMLALPAQADALGDMMKTYLETEVRHWSQDPVLVDAIRSQNLRTEVLSQADIDRMDSAWQAEVGATDQPTIQPVITSAASDFLRARRTEAAGVISEIFIMDRRGLNVAASDTTSDYWQGDEAKFTETAGTGGEALHVGAVEFDESSQTYQGQVSITISDPVTHQVIGAMTVGLNAEMLY